MTCKFIHEDESNWDCWVEPLLFVVLEVLQTFTESLSYCSAKSLQRTMLDMIKENWKEGLSQGKNEFPYVIVNITHSPPPRGGEWVMLGVQTESDWSPRWTKQQPSHHAYVLRPIESWGYLMGV